MPAALLLAATLPAAAGQPAGGIDLSLPGTPSAAESGKARLQGPPAAAPGASDGTSCAPALACGARLLGSVRKNGAVELQVPALRW